jgi:hypothetical protein
LIDSGHATSDSLRAEACYSDSRNFSVRKKNRKKSSCYRDLSSRKLPHTAGFEHNHVESKWRIHSFIQISGTREQVLGF